MRNKGTALVNLFSLLLLLGSSYAALALPEDSQQEIRIASDSAFIDKIQGQLVYSGNVEMIQGTLNIKADSITLIRNDDGLQRIIAKGKPAHYEQTIVANEGATVAYGHTIIFQAANEELTLLKNAGLEKQGNIFTGEKIVYLLKEQRIKADRADDERVHAIIQPKKEKDPAAQGIEK
jgi:lipopolysaccharide export system protein LptA